MLSSNPFLDRLSVYIRLLVPVWGVQCPLGNNVLEETTYRAHIQRHLMRGQLGVIIPELIPPSDEPSHITA